MNKTFKFLIILMVIATMGLIFNASIESVAMSEEEKVNMDLSRINVPDQAIISFPVVIHSVFNNQIEWESSDHDVLDFMDGWFVLTRSPEVDHTVTLTVTVTSSADSEVSGTKAFEVFVPKGVTSTKNYTITYENVTEEEIDQANLRETYRLGEATFDLGVPTREGYDFLGWYLEDTFETEVTEVKVGSMKDLTFFAKWEVSIASYKVEHYQQGLDGFYA